MNINPSNLLLTLIAGLVLAALLGWIRKPRLVVFVPRLFSYSALSAKGQLVEISVFNRGFKTEESIEIYLGPNFRYEVVGANSTEVKLSESKLSIPRIGPGDDVTTLLLVEGGAFTHSEISNCLSKESKGSTVTKLEDVPPTGPQRIGLVAVFVALPIIIYLGYHLFTSELTSVGNNATASATKSATESATKSAVAAATGAAVIQDWSIQHAYAELAGPLFVEFKNNNIRITIGSLVRKKDLTTVPISIENRTSFVLKASLSMNTQRSEEKIPSYDRRLSDVLVVPETTVKKSINVIVPTQSSNTADKKIYIEVFLQEAGGDTLKLLRTYVVPSE